jgi:hypothetical protein
MTGCLLKGWHTCQSADNTLVIEPCEFLQAKFEGMAENVSRRQGDSEA